MASHHSYSFCGVLKAYYLYYFINHFLKGDVIMKKLFIFIATFIMLIAGGVFSSYADTEHWVDPSFDFTKVKTVSPIIIDYTPNIDRIDRHKIEDLTMKQFQIKNAKILNSVDGTNTVCDLIIYVKVSGFGYDREYREGTSYSYQTTTSAPITNSSGQTVGYTRIPQTNFFNIPGGDISVACAYANIIICDAKTGNIVYEKRDNRRRSNPTILNNTEPKDVYKRIIKDLCKDLDKLIAGEKL